MSKHTESWTVELDNPLAAIPGHTVKRDNAAHTPVAIVPKGKDQDKRAHLIASAPDLLAACMMFCERIANAPASATFSASARQIVMDSVDEMQDAISKAKAKGEA